LTISYVYFILCIVYLTYEIILDLEEVEMASEIEKMNNMRRNIVRDALIGSVTAFGVFIYPTIFSLFINLFINNKYQWPYFYLMGPRWDDRYLMVAFILWFLTLLVFMTRYWLYKKKLRKDPSLRSAVNDERVRLNWLKAHRFAFFTATGITIVWKWGPSFFSYDLLMGKFHLPNGPFLVLYVAVISFIGSFLYYNREVKDG